MAFYLEKQSTTSTPHVLIDEEKSYMKIEGRSFHENVVDFFEDVDRWLTNYLESDFKAFKFDCELNYFNSSTAKLLLNMLIKMDRHTGDGKAVVVNWITTEDNEIMIECGEDFRDEVSGLEFNLIVR